MLVKKGGNVTLEGLYILYYHGCAIYILVLWCGQLLVLGYLYFVSIDIDAFIVLYLRKPFCLHLICPANVY